MSITRRQTPKKTTAIEETAIKAVECTQKAVDAIPYRSGYWRVLGVPGLYVRALATCHSFYVQRKVHAKIVKHQIGPVKVADAKEAALAIYSTLSPKPAPGKLMTLAKAYEQFKVDKQDTLADKTKHGYDGFYRRYLEPNWGKLALLDIAKNRPGVRQLYRDIKKDHGLGSARSTFKLFSSIWTWARGEDIDLPESPTTAVKLDPLKARDWAMDDSQLRAWWADVVKLPHPVQQMFFVIGLFTGGRRGSIEALEVRDVDLERGTVYFRTAKGKPYTALVSDVLKNLLTKYLESGVVKPGDRWLLPSPRHHGKHVSKVDGRAHDLRHTYKTTSKKLSLDTLCTELLLGHSLHGVADGYVTAGLLGDNLKATTNAISNHYAKVLGLI